MAIKFAVKNHPLIVIQFLFYKLIETNGALRGGDDGRVQHRSPVSRYRHLSDDRNWSWQHWAPARARPILGLEDQYGQFKSRAVL